MDGNIYNNNRILEEKMIQTIDEHQFRRAFEIMRPDSFSYEGLGALFLYLDELDTELDVIAIDCDYYEYGDIKEFNSDYNTHYDNYNEIDETTVLYINEERFIIQVF